jgi:hypothetical protein
MTNFVLIFTNLDSLRSVDPEVSEVRNLPLIYENDFIGFNEDTGVFEGVSAICESFRLYLVRDVVSQETFASFVDYVDKDRLFILKHKLPKLQFEGIPERNIKVGQHESNGPFYNDVLTFIDDTRGEKVARIFKLIFTHDPILEAKLALLSAILNGKTPAHLDKSLELYQEALSVFEGSKTHDDPFAAEFQSAFGILRDALEVC